MSVRPITTRRQWVSLTKEDKKMPCYKPLKGMYVYDTKNGKTKVVFNELNEKYIKLREVDIPCGHCIGCRLSYASNWAMRCQLEAKEYPENYFLTLTYDEAHLPVRDHMVVDQENGEIVKEETVATLIPEDFTKFEKDLRRYYDYHYNHQNIRFFGCGEYGTKNQRPHYHIIQFNTPLNDLKLVEESFTGAALYESPTISKIWGKGIVRIGSVTYESCAYVARYTMKKANLSKLDEIDSGKEPEFIRMSRNPGIGNKYLEENQAKIKKYDNIIIQRDGKPITFKPPKYFDKFLTEDEKLERQEKRIKIAFISEDQQNELTSLDKDQRLKTAEEIIKQKTNPLKRNLL